MIVAGKGVVTFYEIFRIYLKFLIKIIGHD